MSIKLEVPVNQGRFLWIDNLKAVGIILVVFAHNRMDAHIQQYIYAFHMPLFFFLSGVVFNGHKYNFPDFIRNKFQTRIKPYLLLSAVTYLFWMLVVIPLSVRGGAHQVDKLKAFLGIFYGIGTGVWANQMAVALWFLPCLFCVEMIYYPLVKMGKGSKVKIAVLSAVVVAFGIYLNVFKVLPFRIPWSADAALIAVAFYSGGHLLKDLWDNVQKQRASGWHVAAAALLFCAGLFLSDANGRIDMSSNHIVNPLLFILTPFCFIVVLIYLFRSIKIPGFAFLGQNTLPILAYHFIALFVIRSVCYVFNGNPQPFESLTIFQNILLVVVEFLVLYPVIFLHNKYLGWLLK